MSGSRNGAPLEGVRVGEIGSLLAGPFCGHLLADIEAEVIEVQYNGAVYEKAQGPGEEEWDGLRGRGII